jgi:hypothetical protein
MTITEQWDRSIDERGAVLAPAGEVNNATIEVVTPGYGAVAGVAPANIVLILFVDDVGVALEQIRDAGVPIARGLEDTSW